MVMEWLYVCIWCVNITGEFQPVTAMRHPVVSSQPAASLPLAGICRHLLLMMMIIMITGVWPFVTAASTVFFLEHNSHQLKCTKWLEFTVWALNSHGKHGKKKYVSRWALKTANVMHWLKQTVPGTSGSNLSCLVTDNGKGDDEMADRKCSPSSEFAIISWSLSECGLLKTLIISDPSKGLWPVKKLSVEVLAWLSVWGQVQICI